MPILLLSHRMLFIEVMNGELVLAACVPDDVELPVTLTDVEHVA